MELPYIPLNQAISELRTELLNAVEAARDEQLTFKVGSVELELQVVANQVGKAEVGASIWSVLTAKGAMEIGHAATHKVKLVLEPVLNGQTDSLMVSDNVPSNLR